MKRLIKFLVFAPTAVILIALSVANRNPVSLSLDPFNAEQPAISFDIPIYWLMFGSLAFGMLLGGFVVWLKQGRYRKEAREQKYATAVAKGEAQKFREQAKVLSRNALPAPKAG